MHVDRSLKKINNLFIHNLDRSKKKAAIEFDLEFSPSHQPKIAWRRP